MSASTDVFDLSQIYSQITTHPEIDLYPAISPDGKWIAFSSKRSGNMDIWIKPITGGSAVQITTHRTDDLMPSWSPNGKQLVFVSCRDDALGDLWLVSVEKANNRFSVIGKPKKLTSYLGVDVSPVFSPEGNFIAFTSDRDGKKNIYLYKLKNKKVYQITKNGAINPTWSPDRGKRIAFVSFNEKTAKGQIFYAKLSFKNNSPQVTSIVPVTTGLTNDAFPCWNPVKDEIFFTRYDTDTNQDGQINPDDQPGLWKVILKRNNSNLELQTSTEEKKQAQIIEKISEQENIQLGFQEIQLMPALNYDYYPVCRSDSLIYFISRRGGNDDIWSVSAEGPIPRNNSAFFQYQFAAIYFPLPATDLLLKSKETGLDYNQLQYRLLAFNRVVDFFPTENLWVGWSLYEIAKTYAELGQHSLARTYNEEILVQFINLPELIQRTHLRLFELNFKSDKNQLQAQIDRLEKIKINSNKFPDIQAEAQLFISETYFLHNHYSLALNALEKLLKIYPAQKEKCALAQLLIGDIYSIFGQTGEVINSYLKVLQNYPLQELWVNLALDKILASGQKENFYDTISSYRNIIARYEEYPRLAARAQLKLGELFYNQKDYEAAIEEISLVSENYFDQKEEVALAELLLAKVFIKKNEDLRAIKRYKNIIQNFGNVQAGLYVVEAKERLLETYLKTGNKFRTAGETNAARLQYRSAIEIAPRQIDANRGMIAMMYVLGRIDDAIHLYENLRQTYADDEIILYMLGLCYSYKATEQSDKTKNLQDFNLNLMKKSNSLIENALSKNYRITQAYLTLSYNYEFIEKYESALRAKKRNIISSFFRTTIVPIKSVFYWITFQKEKKPEQWFEKAIDALTTAIALNDEKGIPLLESELALNLASNYYNLKEFGFERAYYYYHVKLQYDSTFTSDKTAAEVYKRMGHCALVVEDFKQGPAYLKKAIKLYQDLGDKQNWLLNVKRLALLYQLAGEYDESVDYFKIAAEQDKKKKLYTQLEIDYRSISYNYLLLNDEEEAIRYGQAALDLIKKGKVKTVKAKPNWIKIGILGIEFPVWNLGQIGAGASTAAGGFTTEEEIALIYSIIGQSTLGQRSIDEAIYYLNKKLEIYRNRKDKIAEAIFLNNIGYLYYLNFKPGKAWTYYEKSLKICKDENNIPGLLINTLNLGALGVLINKMAILPVNVTPDSVQQNLINEPSHYYNTSIQYLHRGLSLYDKEPIGFFHEKVQMYNLLGSLHFLNNLSLPDSLTGSQVEVVKNQLAQFQSWAVADSCYQAALKISQKRNFKIEAMLNLQNIGYLSLALGDFNDALDKFFEAREIAIEKNLSSWLWQIDFALGQILSSYTDYPNFNRTRQDAGYYLNEAITTLEQSAHNLKSFRVTPFYQHQVRLLYQTAVDYSISTGNVLTALRLTEQYRGKQYLDIIGSHKLELKKERHKIFLGNARFLKSEIAALDKKIRMAKEQNKKVEQQVALWINQKKKYEDEYLDLLAELKDEDPELESFIHVEPVTYTQVQKILNENTILIDYFIAGEKLYIWTITSEAVDFFQMPIDRFSLEVNVNTFISDLSNNLSSAKSGLAIRQDLIQPIANKIDSFKTIIIIPDGALNNVPFSYLINFVNFDKNSTKNIVTAPGLSNYYYSYLKRKIKGTKLLLASSRLKSEIYDIGYDGENLVNRENRSEMTQQQFHPLLLSADLIYLDAVVDLKNNDPLMSTIKPNMFKQMQPMKVKNLYSLDLNSSLVVLNGIDKTKITYISAIERALLYAGSPSLIVSILSSENKLFWEYFFDALLDCPVAEAVTRTQVKMFQAGYDPGTYSFYQVIGFEGMTDEQEIQFAQDRFEFKVEMGNNYNEEHGWDDAIKNYEQALIMAKKQGILIAIENLYDLILECSANGGYWDKAINYQLEIIGRAKDNNDIQTVAEGYNYLVYFYTQNKNFDQALYYQNEYLKLVQQYDLQDEIAASYHHLGLVYERGGNYEKAVDNFTQAIHAYQELGDSLQVADCFKDRGRIYLLKFDNYSKAIQDQQQSLTIFQNQNNLSKSLEVLQNLGLSHERLANYQSALKYQQQAFNLAQELGSSQWIALSKQYLANVFWKMGNYEQALKFQKQALQIFGELDNLKFQSVGLATQGLILMSLGNVEQGLELEQQALELARQINDRQDMATIHKNISIMYRSQNQWDEALVHIKQALQLDESIGSQRGLGYDYRDLGIIKFQQGTIDEAFQNFRQALTISQQIFDGRNIAQCLYEIGKAHFFLNNMDAALDTLTLAANEAGKLFIPDVEWRALRMAGNVYLKQKKLQESLNVYNRALTVIENMRAQIKVEEYKSGFIDDKLDVYFDLVNLYLKSDQPEKALEIVERAKSRNFIDLLANKDIKFSGVYNQESFEKGKSLQEEVSRVQNEISGLVIKGDKITVPEKQRLAELTVQLNELKQSYQDFLIQLKEQNPELAEMVSVEPQKIDALKTVLPDSVIMVEYFYTEKQLFIWAVTNENVVAKQRSLNEDELFLQVDTLRKTIAKQQSISKISSALYELLIAPVEKELSQNRHLIIIPHGILHYLPFSALMDEKEKFLIEKYSISLAPSATVLSICLEKGEAYQKDTQWEPKILAMGNPELGDPQFELPFAEKEIESVKLIYPEVKSFFNTQATETRLKQSSKDANLLLFSCHGEFDATNPLFSALLLASDQKNDGRLEAHEIFGLDMNAYLVAMSACETGLAKIGIGDEVIGLSRSFIYAGSSSLLSSLWKVDDLATAVMIKRFFRYLRQGSSKAKALQQALNFVREHINVHPIYWSAFNITGDFR